MAKAADELSTYRARRDFARTGEPSGARPVAPSRRLRFVVQKHAARRLHYDLRLEWEGVFKSWAVTRGPSLDPRDKRLAVEVEDHPLDYGDFEGTIPRGEYGGGTVQLWDRGYWEPEGDVSPGEALARGELKFRLHGSRLQGSWILVRMRKDRYGSKRNDWLLIKHRDRHARDAEKSTAVLSEDRSVASGRTMAQIAAGKGRRPRPFMLKGSAGAADAVWHGEGTSKPEVARKRAASAGKRAASAGARTPTRRASTRPAALEARTGARSFAVVAGSKGMPDFVAPQLCQSVARPPQGDGWGHEIKLDGYRIQLRAAAGEVALKTRKGLDWTGRFDSIARAATALPDVILDGEVAALDRNGTPDFAALQAAISGGDASRLVYFAFDLLFEKGRDLRALPLAKRKARLQALLAAHHVEPTIRYVEHFETAGDAVLRSACKLELEGIVSKRLDAPYESARNGNWVKAKCRGGHEVVIGGWSTTDGRFRSLLVGVYRGTRLAYVGRVGTGFGSAKLRKLLPRLEAAESAQSPFDGAGAPRRAAGIHWTRPELVAEIELAGWTRDGLVRQAAFKGLREDKPAREVQSEDPAAPDDVALAQPSASRRRKRTAATGRSSARGRTRTKRASAAQAGKPTVMGVVLSNADKRLWPEDDPDRSVTKLELARYYERVGEWLLPHIAGRPCSIVRAPDGYRGEHFFQRHAMRGMSSLLTAVEVPGTDKPYLQVDRVEGLAALAQVAALELHPWNCQPGDTETPGRLVFDLDPGQDVPFDAVVKAANELRERLDQIGLVAFCKTTGGKGLHVVAPLARPRRRGPDWQDAKAFAREVCVRIAADSPHRYLVNMAKRLRRGRIYLDYLRNDRMATAVAPLSTRARAHAPVSMPLSWSQVKPGLDPARYTLHTVPALIARSRAWAGYCEAERSLAAAIARLGSLRAAA